MNINKTTDLLRFFTFKASKLKVLLFLSKDEGISQDLLDSLKPADLPDGCELGYVFDEAESAEDIFQIFKVEYAPTCLLLNSDFSALGETLNSLTSERLTDFRPLDVIENIEKNSKLFRENLQYQQKRFSGVLGGIKRKFDQVHLFDIYQEREELAEAEAFDPGYLAHVFQEAINEDYVPSKGRGTEDWLTRRANQRVPTVPRVEGVRVPPDETVQLPGVQLGPNPQQLRPPGVAPQTRGPAL